MQLIILLKALEIGLAKHFFYDIIEGIGKRSYYAPKQVAGAQNLAF